MKKILLFTLLYSFLSAFSILSAQEYKKLRVGIGTGAGFNFITGDDPLTLIYLEAGYKISDQLLIGLRFQNTVGVQGRNINSYSIVGQYYFSNKIFRPFVGLGFGLYREVSWKNGIGVFPRVGFDVRHFTLNLDFEMIGSNIDMSYLTLKIGFTIGGGRK